MNPRYPIFIPSKSRAATALTPVTLDGTGVPYRLIVEADQAEEYAARFGAAKVLVLPTEYQDAYDTFDELGASKSRGPGAARNYAWDVAVEEGYDWHWVIDDNVRYFLVRNANRHVLAGDGYPLHAMESFALSYSNLGMCGPNYALFQPSRVKSPAFVPNTRIYSCNLIRNAVPLRWRGRYNEDTDLSLRMLKTGWATAQFNAFLQYKEPTQTMRGGNSEAFYDVEGTLAKSQMIVAMHPDVARLAWRFRRWHHYVDYRPFRDLALLRDPDAPPRPTYETTVRPTESRFWLAPTDAPVAEGETLTAEGGASGD